ncbi:MAG TPA: M20/M25/M40 family metallo-hydrolase [Pyrinomonadaceae bacterium]|jgi:hypothetical protein
MKKQDIILRVVVWLFILFVGLITIYRQGPPAAVPADAPAAEFASGRAMQHLKVIAARPHPNNSPALAEVRDYIVGELNKLGLSPELQSAEADEAAPGAQATQNIVARLKGTQAGGKGVLLVAHYDTVDDSYGACDDGAAVAALLETARTLKSGPALQKDVIFLFTDGEENGLWGAKNFVASHPWAEEVEVALNFDARGCSGAVYMFETSENNGWLVREFGKASPRPFANSLMYEIYRSLAVYWTDFTIFKRAGISGLNFAFVDDPLRQHTPLDKLEALDEGSLQHEGAQAVALSRHFGNLNATDPKAADAIYFDVLGLTLIAYPRAWAVPLTLVAVLFFAGLVIFGLWRKKLKLSGVGLGFGALIISVVCSLLAAKIIWAIERALHTGYNSFSNYKIYLLSFVAVALAVTSFIYLWLHKRVATADLTIGALFGWLIMTVLVTWYVPSASFVFVWPFLFSSIGAAFMLARQDSPLNSPLVLGVLAVCAAPGIILLGNTIYILALGSGLILLTLLIVLAVLLCALLVPHILLAAAPRRFWPLPAAALLLGVCLLVVGNARSDQIAANINRPPAGPLPAPATVSATRLGPRPRSVARSYSAAPRRPSARFDRGPAASPKRL